MAQHLNTAKKAINLHTLGVSVWYEAYRVWIIEGIDGIVVRARAWGWNQQFFCSGLKAFKFRLWFAMVEL